MAENKRDFDAGAAQWDENPGRVMVAKAVADTIRAYGALRPDMHVLDFGCGTGLMSLQLLPDIGTLTGADTSAGMLAVFQEKIDAQRLTQIMLNRLDPDGPLALTGTYDCVISSMTLHHIERVDTLLEAFYKVLTPGGCICLADLDSEDGSFHDSNDGVFHYGFDQAELTAKAAAAGFHEIRFVPVISFPKPTASGEVKTFSIFLMMGIK